MIRQWWLSALTFASCTMVASCAASIGERAGLTGLGSSSAHLLEPADCASADLRIEGATVVGSEWFAAGTSIADGGTPGARAEHALCRIRLILRPVPGSEINTEVWLPARWNGKLLGLGGGGFDGSLSPGAAPAINKAVGQGYATVVTDAGHTPAPSVETWAHRQPQRIADFGHRAQHLSAVAAKEVVSAVYRKPAHKAYFVGCTNGGRDGLMLAQRYPADYDAIVAGAPALNYTEIVTQLIWNSRAASSAPGLTAKLPLLTAAITRKCDAIDGVQDGILENPRLCRFDPAEIQCNASADPKTCLSPAEVDAARRVYGGARYADGRRVYQGPALGSEGNPGSWGAWVTGPVPAIAGQEFYRWLVYDDPTWSVASFDMDRDYPVARERVVPQINAENPDLRPFVERGGKLIMYQGWDDPAITPDSTISYFEAARAKTGDRQGKSLRLFMVPGMAHCGGGPGATSFDMQSVLENWVETGNPPTSVAARNPEPSAEPLTRPLCPWPQTAHYRGTGSSRDAANFVCRG
jgi:feruloyl esterase